ncbi:unnamed protein product [Cylindrotheca closterium]|uniref:Uncharacterized protein n=1 Tax=Cylindrotheca closterium TaxID=2856 RepID=A0AAD2JMG9_9STRA|nr:unnamed protein product [Cylindrotheca closterium]
MSPAATATATATTNTSSTSTSTSTSTTTKKSYDELTMKQLIAELQKRDKRIVELEKQLPKPIDPAKTKVQAYNVKQLAIKGIKKVMVYKPACKQGRARFAWSSMCDEARVVWPRICWKLGGPRGWRTRDRSVGRWETAAKSRRPGEARQSHHTPHGLATFRAFMDLKGAEKTKGQKMSVELFNDFTGYAITKSIRYDTLSIKSENVNITYLANNGQI